MKSIKLSIVALFIASASFAQVKEVKTETAKAVQAPVATVTPAPTPKQSLPTRVPFVGATSFAGTPRGCRRSPRRRNPVQLAKKIV